MIARLTALFVVLAAPLVLGAMALLEQGVVLRAAAPGLAQAPAGTLIDHSCTNCANAVAATNDAVWSGTMNVGVVRWDRATGAMRQFTRADGLGGDSVWRLAAEPSGRVWAAMRGRTILTPYTGLSVYDGGRWTHYPMATAPITTAPQSMVADPVAGVWLSNGATTSRFDGAAWFTPLATDGAPRGGHLATDAEGVWLASGQVVYQLVGGLWTPRQSFATRIPNGDAAALAVASDSSLYVALAEVGTFDSLGVARFDGTDWRLYTVVDGLATDNVRVLAIDGEGTVWTAHGAGPHAGLSAFDGTRWRVVWTSDTPGLPGDTPQALDVAPDGALAMAGTSGGAGIHGPTGWTTFRDETQPAAYIPFALGEAPDGALWVGFGFSSGAHAIQRRSGGRWQTWTLADGIPPMGALAAHMDALALDADGTPWLGTWFDGLLTRTGDRWHALNTADGLPSNTIRDVLVAPDGRLWVATDAGLARRDGAGWTVFGTADGLPNAEVRALVAEPGGAIWAGTSAGAARFDDVRSIAIGLDGAVWFGTYAGLARRDARGWRTWTVADGLTGDRFQFGLDVDASGRAWAGLHRDDDFSLGLIAVDDTGWQLLTDAEGLHGSDNDDLVFDVKVTRDGHVWIASLHGLQEFVPDPLVPWPTPVPTATPAVPSCSCRAARRALPAAVLADALANPASYAGWGERVNPNLPPSPANPLRACLDIQNPGTPYNPTFNGPVWRGSCR